MDIAPFGRPERGRNQQVPSPKEARLVASTGRTTKDKPKPVDMAPENPRDAGSTPATSTMLRSLSYAWLRQKKFKERSMVESCVAMRSSTSEAWRSGILIELAPFLAERRRLGWVFIG